MNNTIKITVDGRTVEVNPGLMLLDALRGIGVEVPTLCYHPSLSHDGACRLCVVEITKEGWGDWSNLVTSCLYPVEEGLIISTHSEKVKESRKTLLELYLANSPDSEELKAVARIEGVDSTPFTSPENADNCINCAMCIRTCQDLGPAAISGLNRGIDKAVGPGTVAASDCTGCLSCAHICPTNHITTKRENQKLTIWNREFSIPVCSVDAKKCTACGICEEVCPFAIPKISLFRNGNALSSISKTDCVGCGICAGACPNSAISQEPLEKVNDMILDINDMDIKGKNIVFACSRSKTDKEDVVLVSCIGKVNLETIFRCIVKGANSIGLMCRDQATCEFGQGGALAEARLPIIQELLKHNGLDKNMLQVITPDYGKEGPDDAIDEFRRNSKASLLKPVYQGEFNGHGFDAVLEAIKWINDQKEINPVVTLSYKSFFDKDGNAALYLGNIISLDLLVSLITEEAHVNGLLADTLLFLQKKNIKVKPVFNAKQASFAKEIYVLSNHNIPDFGKGSKVISISEIAGDKVKYESDNAPVFNVSMKIRREIINKAKTSKSFVCKTPVEVARTAFVLRKGSWQEALDVIPQMSFKIQVESKVEEEYRIHNHPIMPQMLRDNVQFTFNGKNIEAKQGEVISSALYAAGVSVFGHHHKDKGPQGIYCVNGQCSQCMVLANGKPVKSCMIPVLEGMEVESVEGHPELREAKLSDISPDVENVEVSVLIIGGGPAGICAATELGKLGVEVIIIDDKQELGGKLSLQTHNFFGSVSDCWAGTRGMDIGHILNDELERLSNVKVWLNSTVVGVYVDKKFGVVTNGQFRLISADRVLISAGAREKGLAFEGSDLPGVYGAGAFQTLVNRDLIKCAKKLFIIGGGNVGLIGAYHALQAGIDVVGLVEALPSCGGYKVHEDKIKRLGVPVLTSHTVLKVEGNETVERVTIAQIDSNFKPISGTERSFDVDTVLVAVGLSPVNEFLEKAKMYGIKAYAAGDAEEIAEASAAIFSGKITGRRIARDMGIDVAIPSNWESFGDILKHRPTEPDVFKPIDEKAPVFPVIRCVQEIPCDPCVGSCPKNLISMKDSILSTPEFSGACLGCSSCVRACPGLAITLVFNDYDPKHEKALVMVPFEFINSSAPMGQVVVTTDMDGKIVGKGKVIAVKDRESQDRRKLMLLEVPDEHKLLVAGFRIREIDEGEVPDDSFKLDQDPIVCRCERVRKSELVKEIREGVRDMNQLKAITRSGLGGCGGKTCTDLILRLYREEGIPLEEITLPTHRPLVAEVHLGDFVKKVEDK